MPPFNTLSDLNMTSKQLTKFAAKSGWFEVRKGRKHMIWKHTISQEQITIPYQVRETVVPQIMKQLVKKACPV